MDEKLCAAARYGKLVEVQRLLESSANPNSRCRGQPALHWAIQEGQVECAHELVKSKADINAVDSYQETALHIATRRCVHRSVYFLMACGCETKLPNWMGETAEDIVKAHADPAISAAVLWQSLPPDAIPHTPPRPTTPDIEPPHVRLSAQSKALCTAASAGEVAILESLLEGNADPNACWQGAPALVHACTHEQPGCTKRLLEWKADINALDSYNQTALHWVCRRGAVECAKVLVVHSADAKLVNWMGETADDILLAKNNLDLMHVLLWGPQNAKRQAPETAEVNPTASTHVVKGYPYLLQSQAAELAAAANVPERFLDDDGNILRTQAADLAQLRFVTERIALNAHL
eukprot:GGOE01000352.1.p1 GENE.GGOE01000352.1~~GGOE01000352.1.p1  ORF type:complete len:349 (-),score=67.50 GGOE01000352.1:131-1177(-)